MRGYLLYLLSTHDTAIYMCGDVFVLAQLFVGFLGPFGSVVMFYTVHLL